LNIKGLFLFTPQILSEIFLILRIIQRGVIINVYKSLCKVAFQFLDFKEVEFFSTDFLKILKYKISSIGSPVVPCGRMDGLRGMTKITVAFRNFTKSHKTIKKEVLGKQSIKYCECRKNWII